MKKAKATFYGELPSNEIVAIQKEIDMLQKQRVEALERLYNLGYKRLLKNE